tara:strand:+ start:2569 stop:3642 length:1074 start_codon:yes stop_codon:yes gene_type:complete
MSDPLDTAWRILKEPVVGSEHQSSLTPGSGAVVGPGGQIFFGDQYQVAMGGNRQKPQNRTDSFGSKLGRFAANQVQQGGDSTWSRGMGAMFQPQSLHIRNPKGTLGRGWNHAIQGLQSKVDATPASLAGLAARGVGHAANVGSMVASLPLAALGFNEGQQSGSFGGAMDATLAGYGKGRALTNLGSRVAHGYADRIQDAQRGYDQSMAEHEKAQQEAAAAPPEAEQNTSQIGDMLTASGYDSHLAQNRDMQAAIVQQLLMNQQMINPPTNVDASHGTDPTATAVTDAAQNEQKLNSLPDEVEHPMNTLDPQSGGIASGSTLGGDQGPLTPAGFGNMVEEYDIKAEPMDLAWRMLQGV